MATKNITDENFETEVLKEVKPVLVKFSAIWCAPCKAIDPILEEISNEMKEEIIIAKHDIDNHPNQPSNGEAGTVKQSRQTARTRKRPQPHGKHAY